MIEWKQMDGQTVAIDCFTFQANSVGRNKVILNNAKDKIRRHEIYM